MLSRHDMSDFVDQDMWSADLCALIEAGAETFDQTLPWLECFQRHVVGPREQMVLTRTEDDAGRMQAVLPMLYARVAVLGGIRLSALTAASNYYTAAFGPIVRPGTDARCLESLAAATLTSAQHVNVVDLNPVADDSAFLTCCLRMFGSHGWFTQVYPRFGNWIEPVAGRSFKEFLKDRPGNLRSTLSRKSKRLGARAGARYRIVTDEEQVEHALNQYEAVYRTSWKSDEPYKGFIRQVCLQFARRGWLRLGVLEVEGEPVAAQIWFTYRQTASIFKLAYDPRYADLSVGSLLSAHLFQYALDVDKVQVVDYLCGDDPYKRDWMTVRRQRVGLRAVRRSSSAGLLERARRTATLLRRAV